MNRRKASLSVGSKTMHALFILMLLFSGGIRAQVTDLSQQDDLQQRRSVMEIEERIRILYSQGKYVDVLDETDQLLELDPDNQRALLWRDNAERRLAHGGLRPMDSLRGAPLPTPSSSRLDRHQEMEAPPPLEPRRRYSADNFFTANLNYILIALGVVFGILLIALAISWLKGRKSAAPAARPAAAGMGGLGLGRSSQTTWLGDQKTQQDQQTRGTESYDPPTSSSVFDMPTNPDIPTEYGSDDTNYDPQTSADQTAVEPPERQFAYTEPPLAEDELEPPVQADPRSEFLSFDNLYHEHEEPEADSTMGIDYTDTDAPMARSQADDVQQTGENVFGDAPSETLALSAQKPEQPEPGQEEEDDIVPPAYEAPPIYSNSDADDLLGTELEEDTLAIGKGPQPDPQTAINLGSDFALDETASLDPNAQTFNTLMFGSEKEGDEVKVPETPPEEDLTQNSFNNEFSNVMFGAGADETKVPDLESPTQVEEPAETIRIEPESNGSGQDKHDEEKTAVAAGPPAGSPSRISMFDRQRDAGKRALDAEDYARAVQCFSVAASLKPNDKEVRELLEEARSRRRG